MYYNNILKASFIDRPNRFIANIKVGGETEVAHVKNTGRCKELLLPQATIYVQHHDNPKRKTKYSLIAVEKDNLLINMDSQAPNKVVQEWLEKEQPFGTLKVLKPETVYGNSRFDFYLETNTRKMFLEVKGVTLENNGIVKFPDAPTQRGVKHIEELCHCLQDCYEAIIIFVVQMQGMKYFTPNRKTHSAFADALVKAQALGVKILAVECSVTPNSLEIVGNIPIHLND